MQNKDLENLVKKCLKGALLVVGLLLAAWHGFRQTLMVGVLFVLTALAHLQANVEVPLLRKQSGITDMD